MINLMAFSNKTYQNGKWLVPILKLYLFALNIYITSMENM